MPIRLQISAGGSGRAAPPPGAGAAAGACRSCPAGCASAMHKPAGHRVAIGGPEGTHRWEGRGLGGWTAARGGSSRWQQLIRSPCNAWGCQGRAGGSVEPRSGGSAAMPALPPCCSVGATQTCVGLISKSQSFPLRQPRCSAFSGGWGCLHPALAAPWGLWGTAQTRQ